MKAEDSKRKLRREEWDFSLVPDEEVQPCLFYELSRELPNPTETFTPWPSEGSERGEAAGDDLFLACVLSRDLIPGTTYAPAWFPSKPWQKIPAMVRRAALAHVGHEYSTGVIPLPSANRRLPENSVKAAEQGFQEVRFMIDWKKTNTDLAADFHRWLTTHRSTKPPVKLGRQSPADALRALGALRLRNRYSVDEAVEVTRDALGQPLYAHRAGWDKACKRAIEEFRKLFPYARATPPTAPTPWPKEPALPKSALSMR